MLVLTGFPNLPNKWEEWTQHKQFYTLFIYKNVLYKNVRLRSDQNKERNKKAGEAGEKRDEWIWSIKKYLSLDLVHIEQ